MSIKLILCYFTYSYNTLYYMSNNAIQPLPNPDNQQQGQAPNNQLPNNQPLNNQLPNNQPLNIYHANRHFVNGLALFRSLEANEDQAFKDFKRLNDNNMAIKILDLEFWMGQGGPRQDEITMSNLYLRTLKQFRELEANRKRKMPGILFEFMRQLYQGLISRLASKKKPTIQQAAYGSEKPLLQEYGDQDNISNVVGDVDILEQNKEKLNYT